MIIAYIFLTPCIFTDPFLALQTDLFAVHPDFINTSDNVVNSQVTRLLQELGVKNLSTVEVIGHHIMPVLKSSAWEVKNPTLLHNRIWCCDLFELAHAHFLWGLCNKKRMIVLLWPFPHSYVRLFGTVMWTFAQSAEWMFCSLSCWIEDRLFYTNMTFVSKCNIWESY